MVHGNLLKRLQRFQNSQALLSLSKHRLAVGHMIRSGMRPPSFSLNPAGASLEAGGEIAITQSARVVRPRENLEKCRQRSWLPDSPSLGLVEYRPTLAAQTQKSRLKRAAR